MNDASYTEKMMEIWKPVNNFEGFYEVSNYGRVRSIERVVEHQRYGKMLVSAKLLKPWNNMHGYCNVNLMKDGERKVFKVHRLVAEAFIPNPENKYAVNHKDGNKENNHYLNLEWCTKSENELHKCRVLGRYGGGPQKKERCKDGGIQEESTGDSTEAFGDGFTGRGVQRISTDRIFGISSSEGSGNIGSEADGTESDITGQEGRAPF